MKKNISSTMERLEIDENIRDLICKLWKHGYKTDASCQGGGNGHSKFAYVLFIGGDGWFERNAERYGLSKSEHNSDCEIALEDFRKDVLSFGLDPDDFKDTGKACRICGSGINGYSSYKGNLIIPNRI